MVWFIVGAAITAIVIINYWLDKEMFLSTGLAIIECVMTAVLCVLASILIGGIIIPDITETIYPAAIIYEETEKIDYLVEINGTYIYPATRNSNIAFIITKDGYKEKYYPKHTSYFHASNEIPVVQERERHYANPWIDFLFGVPVGADPQYHFYLPEHFFIPTIQ